MRKGAKLSLAAFLLCVSFFSISAEAEPFETIINNGNSQNRIDIAVLGDGYTAGELSKYQSDTQSFIQGFFAQEPFREYQRYFNVHRVDVTSAQSGADHPERSSFVDTALDATYNCAGIQRLICVSFSKVSTVITNSLTPIQRDMVIIIVNDSEYGGSGGAFAVTSTNASGIEIVLHEAGHSFGSLADEYGGPPPPNCNNTFEPSAANATKETQRSLIKWNAWIDASTPIPTAPGPAGVPGLYQGAQYCDSGLYRPTSNSKMRSLGFPFEQINSEQLVKRVYNLVTPIDSKFPSADNLSLTKGQTQSFSVSTPLPLTHDLTVVWRVDGQQQASGAGFNLDTNSLSTGNHSVTATVTDATAFVRNDPNQLLTVTTNWSVNVNAASTLQLDASSYIRNETDLRVDVLVTRIGDTTGACAVNYATGDTAGSNGCNVVAGLASARCDYPATIGTLRFAANETSKTLSIPIVDDSYAEGTERFTITLSNPVNATLGSPSSATIDITDNDNDNGPNPIDNSSFFVRQHYVDFLNREPDTAGLNFWVGEIEGCTPKPQCTEIKRINVSAAFFLSIEFQQTGYLVYRIYKAAFGEVGMPVPIRLVDFQPDTRQIGQGVVVNQPGWEQVLEANKQTFVLEFVQRLRFTQDYPSSLTPAEFVERLFLRAEVTPSISERDAAINEFGSAPTSSDVTARARALRLVAENSTLSQQNFNKAFVLMQYFGYLQRNPFDPPEATLDFQGYNFWLTKLNQFDGNFVNAEMVKAFITSGEYRQRFGP